MALTREESTERQQAVLRFFMDNPDATGDRAQEMLTKGRLLPHRGKEQTAMGIAMIFRLQRQAKELRRRGASAPDAQPAPALVASSAAPAAPNEEQMKRMRERAIELQRLLAAMPPGMLEVRVSRDGVDVVSLTPTTQRL